jgi:hypothetical protein
MGIEKCNLPNDKLMSDLIHHLPLPCNSSWEYEYFLYENILKIYFFNFKIITFNIKII